MRRRCYAADAEPCNLSDSEGERIAGALKTGGAKRVSVKITAFPATGHGFRPDSNYRDLRDAGDFCDHPARGRTWLCGPALRRPDCTCTGPDQPQSAAP